MTTSAVNNPNNPNNNSAVGQGRSIRVEKDEIEKIVEDFDACEAEQIEKGMRKSETKKEKKKLFVFEEKAVEAAAVEAAVQAAAAPVERRKKGKKKEKKDRKRDKQKKKDNSFLEAQAALKKKKKKAQAKNGDIDDECQMPDFDFLHEAWRFGQLDPNFSRQRRNPVHF